MTDRQLRAARLELYALIAALLLATGIAAGITTGAFVLSFAVQRDLAHQAGIPQHLTWLFRPSSTAPSSGPPLPSLP